MTILHRVKSLARNFRSVTRSDPAMMLRKEATIASSTQFYDSTRIVRQHHPVTSITVGAHSHIRGELLLFAHGGNIRIGEYCYLGEHSRIWSGVSVELGDRVLVAHNVTIMDNLTHPLDAQHRHEQFKSIITSGHPTDIDLDDQAVRIDDDVWVGCNSVINRGITIGESAIIAAGSVVTKDVKPRTVVGGNPAKIIKSVDSQ